MIIINTSASMTLSLPLFCVLSSFIEFSQKELCEGKHDAQVRKVVSNLSVLASVGVRWGVKEIPFYPKA